MPTEIDLSTCSCCECCPYARLSLPSVHVYTNFEWNDGTDSPSFNADWGGSSWSAGGIDCNGQTFSFSLSCSNDQWLFTLVSGGIDYSVPFGEGPGGCNLLSCFPFLVFGEVSSGPYFADDFPFCDKSGTFPDGQYLIHFTFLVSE